jgi:hypothetical protein
MVGAPIIASSVTQSVDEAIDDSPDLLQIRQRAEHLSR